MTEKEKRLLSILAKVSYHYSPTPAFRLASGKMSKYYIDCKTTTLTPEGLALTGEVIFERINDLSVQGVGGLEFGAIPLALSTSIYAFHKGINIKPFVVRKQAKDRGLKKAIEGQLYPMDRVIVLEDVITTGNSCLMAVQKLKEADIFIDRVLVIVDRLEGGKENIIRAGLIYESIFNLDDLHHELSKN